jgi:WD40 repeat protein
LAGSKEFSKKKNPFEKKKKMSSKVAEFVAHRGGAVTCIDIGQKSGMLLVTGNSQGYVNVWTVAAPLKKPLRRLHAGQDAPLQCVAFDAKEEHVMASYGTVVKIWDLQYGRLVRTFGDTFDSGRDVDALGFHPLPSAELMAASDRIDCKVFDIRNRRVQQTLKGAGTFLAFSPDGHWVATSTSGGTGELKLFESASGTLLGSADARQVCAAAFHPKSLIMAALSSDGSVAIVDLDTSTHAFAVVARLTGARGARHIAFAGADALYAVADSHSVFVAERWRDNDAAAASMRLMTTTAAASADGGTFALHAAHMRTGQRLLMASARSRTVALHTFDAQQRPGDAAAAAAASSSSPAPPMTLPSRVAVVVKSTSPEKPVVRKSAAKQQRQSSASTIARRSKAASKKVTSAATAPLRRAKRSSSRPSAATPVHSPAAAPVEHESSNDADAMLAALSGDHDSVCAELNGRLRALRVAKALWVKGRRNAAIEGLAQSEHACGAVLDFARAIALIDSKPDPSDSVNVQRIGRLLTLDQCALMLPALQHAVRSPHEGASCSALLACAALVRTFGPVAIVGARSKRSVDKYETSRAAYSAIVTLKKFIIAFQRRSQSPHYARCRRSLVQAFKSIA